MRFFFLIVLGGCALLATPLAAQDAQETAPETGTEVGVENENAKDEGELSSGTGLTLQDRIRAVSNASFLKKGRVEIEPFLGASVSDAFFRRWTLGARVGYHLLENLSLEVGGAYNAFSQPLDAVRLIGEVDVEFEDETPIVGYGDVGVTFSPIYGKLGVMSEYVLRFDGYVTAGLGATFLSGNEPVKFPAFEVGVGGRFFVNRFLALRGEVRDYITFELQGTNTRVSSLVFLNVGLSVFFPFDFENNDGGVKIVEE